MMSNSRTVWVELLSVRRIEVKPAHGDSAVGVVIKGETGEVRVTDIGTSLLINDTRLRDTSRGSSVRADSICRLAC